MEIQPTRLTERSHHLGKLNAPVSFGLPVLEQFVEAEDASPFVHMSPRHLKKLAREGKVPRILAAMASVAAGCFCSPNLIRGCVGE